MREVIEFKLNGQAVEWAGDPQQPLLYILRNECQARGVRFGCGSGHCGACAVLVGVQALNSCDTPAWAAADQELITPEGLAADPVGAVVQKAFIDLQAAQCGYCINGILMSITALLKRSPRPDAAAIRSALNRHLCRCGTHLRIVRAVDLAIQTLMPRETPLGAR
jgi:nicotinate dehydrogenase subunit A